MISNEEKKFIDNLLSNEKIRKFVSEHDLTYDQIFADIGKFIYVFENDDFNLAKDNIVRVVTDVKPNVDKKYLFAPQNEKLILDIKKYKIMSESKVKLLKDFVKDFKESKKGMYIHGNVGVGKTFVSMQMAKYLIERKKYTAFISIYQYMRYILDNKDRSFVETIINSNYLFIDDLGAETVSAFYLQELFFIIDYRYRFDLPTFFTSNFSLEELANKYAQVDEKQAKRIISRIQDMTNNYIV